MTTLVHTTNPEGNLMVKTASLFSQLLHQIPRHEFAKLVNKHQAEYQS